MFKLNLGLAALLVLLAAGSAKAEDKVVSVTFDSIKAQTAKNGDTLDGSVKFIFADEAGSSTSGSQDTGRARANAFHKDKQEACRWALLGTLLKFQKNAKERGMTKVTDIQISPGKNYPFGGSRNKCQCIAGGTNVGAVVKARYAK